MDQTPLDNGDGAQEDHAMNKRITTAERDLASLKTDVAVIRSNYVTKEDLQRELHNHTWRIIGAIAALTAAVFFIARTSPDPRLQAPQATVAPATSTAPAQQAPQAPQAQAVKR